MSRPWYYSGTEFTIVSDIWKDMRQSIARTEKIISAFENKFSEVVVKKRTTPPRNEIFCYYFIRLNIGTSN
jgi:hypothetical protein